MEKKQYTREDKIRYYETIIKMHAVIAKLIAEKIDTTVFETREERDLFLEVSGFNSYLSSKAYNRLKFIQSDRYQDWRSDLKIPKVNK